MSKTYPIEGVILSRRDYSEADRIVTIFTKEKGKLALLAKSVRKSNSKRQGSLEIGTRIKALAISARSLDILSQTIIVSSYPNLRQDLASITRLYQLMEVIDKLTGEGQDHPEVYQLLCDTLANLNSSQTNRKSQLLTAFHSITTQLGFMTDEAISEINLKARIEAIADKKLHAKDFLTPTKTTFKDSP